MLKTTKKILALCLVLILGVLTICACNQNSNDTDGTDTNQTPTTVELSQDLVIIYESDLKSSAQTLSSRIYKCTKKTPTIIEASAATGTYNNAILLGNTGMTESTDFISKLEDYGYGVKIVGTSSTTRIIIAGKNKTVTPLAATLFLTDYLPDNGVTTLRKTEETIKKTSASDPNIITNVYAGIEFEERLITVADGAGGYTRMAQLQDGRLMMTYGASGHIVAIFSSDRGLTWSSPVKTTENVNDGGYVRANGMPYQTADGTILVAYRCNDSGHPDLSTVDSYYSSIRVVCSRDNGVTWERHSTVIEMDESYNGLNAEFKSSYGVWEPHLGMLNGELACFFAIGKSVYNYDHIIYSTDIFLWKNNTWERAHYTSDDSTLHTGADKIKNGMPVWQEISEGGYILAVESTQNQTTKWRNVLTTKLLTSKDGIHWENQCDVYVPAKTKRRTGAPYVVQLPDGRFVVSYMTNEDVPLNEKDVEDGMKVKISISKKGLNAYQLSGQDSFEAPYSIFNTPTGKTSKYAGMFIDDKYLYVFSATNYPTNRIILRRADISSLSKD